MRRRYFPTTFSLKSLLIFATLAGGGIGWYGYHQRWIGQRNAFLNQPQQSFVDGDVLVYPLPRGLRLLGERPIYAMVICPANDAEADRVRGLFPESFLFWRDHDDWMKKNDP